MIVICKQGYMSTDEAALHLGEAYLPRQALHLTVGKHYVVFGINLAVRSNVHGTGVWLHILSDHRQLSWAPLILFDVIEPSVSQYWKVRVHEGGTVTLWPAEFYRRGFHEDLADRLPATEREFAELKKRIEDEATQKLC